MLDIVRNELDRLAKKNDGILRPEKVFAAAEPADSPLHDYFEWDRDKAYIESNLERARKLIQTYKISYKQVASEKRGFETAQTIPAFTPHPAKEIGYAYTEKLLSGPERQSTLLQEHERFVGHLNRYVGYWKFVGVVSVVRKLEEAAQEARAAIDALRREAAN